MFEGEEFSNKFRHSKHSQGSNAYTEKDAESWYKYKVLDWIDLKLWCIVMDIKPYSKKVLKDAFWSGDYEGGHSLNKTIIPWAYELLNRLTYNQLTASAFKL